jgi:hypothetical protein
MSPNQQFEPDASVLRSAVALGNMKIIGWLFILMLSSAATANCVTYDSAVITGRLQRLVFPGRYNYESIAGGDEAETGFYLFPQTPLCVARGDKMEPFIENVSMVQLVLGVKKEGGSTYASLEPYIGDMVSCSGPLYAAHTGHHHAPIVMWAALCRTPMRNKAFKANTPDGARP